MQTILHIDDDVDDRELFASAVHEISTTAKCVGFSEANKALRALESREIIPDYIFLDLNMPLMNGEEFLNAIKSNLNLNHIRVVIFSTSSHPATILKMIEMGAEAFITKPTDYTEFIEILTPYVY